MINHRALILLELSAAASVRTDRSTIELITSLIKGEHLQLAYNDSGSCRLGYAPSVKGARFAHDLVAFQSCYARAPNVNIVFQGSECRRYSFDHDGYCHSRRSNPRRT